MNSGEICARLYSNGAAGPAALARGHRIRDPRADPRALVQTSGSRPALVDLQINGFAGVDFQRDHSPKRICVRAVRLGCAAAGCGQFLATLMTDRWEMMLPRLASASRVARAHPELESGHCRMAHRRSFPLRGAWILRGARSGPDDRPDSGSSSPVARGGVTDPVLLTLAPERAGALEAIALAVSLGIK